MGPQRTVATDVLLWRDCLNATGSAEKPDNTGLKFHDLQVDPKEDKNMYDELQYQDIIKEMKQELLTLSGSRRHRCRYSRMKEIMDQYYW